MAGGGDTDVFQYVLIELRQKRPIDIVTGKGVEVLAKTEFVQPIF